MNTEVSTKSVDYTSKQIATTSNHHEEKSEEETHYPPERSVCVCPLPKSISREELMCYLYQFGPVKRRQFKRKYFLVEYYNRYL